MTQAVSTEAVYDPQRPWLRDMEDDPTHASWVQVFFNPLGTTRKPVFLRGQVLLWIMRYFTLVLSFTIASGKLTIFGPVISIWDIPGFDGYPIYGILLFLGLFVLFSIMSIISHVRRLRNSDRSPFWALFVPIPMIFALSVATMILGLGGLAMQASSTLETQQEAVEQVEEQASEGPPTEDASDASASSDEQAAVEPQQRNVPPPNRSDFIMGAMIFSFLAWFIIGFFPMLFTTLFVARGKSDIDVSEAF